MVDLTLAPELVDFDGFINYGTPIFLPLVSQQDGKDEVTMTKASDNFILQPVFSKRSMTSSVRVLTGNTLVIGALKKATSIQYEDKIPVLGDIPWVGRLFRSQGSKEQRKAIIIMVKAEVVDPGGKELYTRILPFRKLRKAVRIFPLLVPLSKPLKNKPVKNSDSDPEFFQGAGNIMRQLHDSDSRGVERRREVVVRPDGSKVIRVEKRRRSYSDEHQGDKKAALKNKRFSI